MIGQLPRRNEDVRLIVGGGRFVDDIRLPDLLHLVLVCSTHARASTLLTPNRPVDDWGKLLGDTAAVAAMLNRLLHHAHVIICGPKSWRTRLHSERNGRPDECPDLDKIQVLDGRSRLLALRWTGSLVPGCGQDHRHTRGWQLVVPGSGSLTPAERPPARGGLRSRGRSGTRAGRAS